MPSVSVTIKQKKYHKIYKSYADDIYRICLYFSKDESKARDVTEQIFVEFYKEFDTVESDHIFARLVHEAKRLSLGEHVQEFASGEVRECIANGKN